MDIAIKNVREVDWRLLKAEAARENLKMGKFLGRVIHHYKGCRPKGNLNAMLERKKVLTDEDAEAIRKSIKEFRRDFEFRKFR